MFDDLYPDDVDRALRLEAQTPRTEPKKEPGFFSGLGGASWRGIAQGAVETARSGVSLLEAYGKTVAFTEGAPRNESIDRIFEQSQASKTLGEVARSLDIDPQTTGTAGQIVHGLTKFGAKAVGHTLVEGPFAPLGFGVDEGISEGLRLADKGVDTETAIKAGLVHGAASAASIALPVAGKTIPQTIGLTAAGGPGAFMAEQAAIREILDNADYEAISREYDPTDPLGLIVSTLGPGLFGAGAHAVRARRAAKLRETKSAETGTTQPDSGTVTPETDTPRVPREAVDAARVLLARESVEANRLTTPNDVAGAAAHEAAMARALDQVASGERADVGDIVARERIDLGRAYDLVRALPGGEAFDPLVMIRPDDIEAVAISRGGWKGIGDAEVKGQGFGLVKFIWRHGEESHKPPALQATREDVLAFPEIIRRFEPSRAAVPGGLGREWKVKLPGVDGTLRTVVYADQVLSAREGRHLVSVHVEEPGKPTSATPLSKEKPGWVPESPGKRLEAHTGDTQRGFLHRAGQDQSGSASVPEGARASELPAPGRPTGGEQSVTDAADSSATRGAAARRPQTERDATSPAGPAPSESAALDAAAADLEAGQPDLMVRLDGMDEAVPLAELMARVREEAAQDLAEAPLVQTAVNCALRTAGAGL